MSKYHILLVYRVTRFVQCQIKLQKSSTGNMRANILRQAMKLKLFLEGFKNVQQCNLSLHTYFNSIYIIDDCQTCNSIISSVFVFISCIFMLPLTVKLKPWNYNIFMSCLYSSFWKILQHTTKIIDSIWRSNLYHVDISDCTYWSSTVNINKWHWYWSVFEKLFSDCTY